MGLASAARGRDHAARLATALLLLLSGCPSAAAPEPLAPATALDPPPHTPEPRRVGSPGEPTGLAAAGRLDHARRLAFELLDAIRSGDADGLSRLFGDPVVSITPAAIVTGSDRDQLIAWLVREAGRRRLETSPAVSDLVVVDQVEVTPVAAALEAAALPEELQASDLVVVLPLSEAGRRFVRRLLPGWTHRVRLIVRTGAEPRVVGF